MGYAGFWKRVVAALVDSLILGFVNLGLLLLFTGDAYFRFMESLMSGTPAAAPSLESMNLLYGLASLLQMAVAWLYMAWFESSIHQGTPGKILLGLKVVDQRNQRLSFARATGRSFAKYLSTLTCCIGWLMAAFTERKQGLHDIIAGTFVVPNRPSPPR